MLETTTLVGLDFAPFYNLCRAGQIGRSASAIAPTRAGASTCSASTYSQRKAAALAVCCPDATSCFGHPALPNHCSLECAAIFAEFYEDCAAQAGVTVRNS